MQQLTLGELLHKHEMTPDEYRAELKKSPAPAHLLDAPGVHSMAEFYKAFGIYATSDVGSIALIRSHIAYHTGRQCAATAKIKPSRGHSYRVTTEYGQSLVVRITDYYDHRDGVHGWN